MVLSEEITIHIPQIHSSFHNYSKVLLFGFRYFRMGDRKLYQVRFRLGPPDINLILYSFLTVILKY